MAITYTPRLQLSKPDADEYQLISVLDGNFDLLDKGVGVRMVTAGIIPPNSDLYDGLIVNERDTGKVWIASKNAGGGYDRAWIRYPWSINTTTAGFTLAHNTTVSSPLLIVAGGVNSSASNIVGGKVVTPISGIYRIDVSCLFGPNDNSATNWRSCTVEINNSLLGAGNTTSFVPYNQANSNQRFQMAGAPISLAAGATVTARIFQNSLLAMPGCQIGVGVTLMSVTGINNN